MNFGHGELGFGAWPRAKSMPVAEYCTVFSASTPMALDAFPTTVLASCAEAVQTSNAASASPVRHFLSISHRLSRGRSVPPARRYTPATRKAVTDAQEMSDRTRARRVARLDRFGAGRQDGRRERVQGHGRRRAEDRAVLRDGHGLRPRPGAKPQLA